MDREESGSEALTSLQVRRARQGEAESIAWVVERFTPLLHAQARYRLGPSLARHVDPSDLVHDVWAVALAALPELEGNASRSTPTLVAFLSKTLLLRVNELTRRRIRDESRRAEVGGEGGEPLSALPDETRGIVTRVVASEATEAVRAAIDELGERDREVLVLRGFEQHSNQVAAELLGDSANAVSLRYNRVLERLRRKLPGAVFDELDEADPRSS